MVGNKIAQKLVQPKPLLDMSSRNVEDLVIPPMKFQKNAKRIKTSTINMGYHKISKLSNDSIVPMP